jgi:MFS family permease
MLSISEGAAEGAEVVGPALHSALAPLRVRRFRRWFLVQLLSGSGNQTMAVGQAWLVVQLHGGGIALAVVAGLNFAPSGLLGAPLGGLSDRFDVRRLLVVTQVLQIAIGATLALVTALGHASVLELALFATAMGTVFAADAPARQIYVLRLVGERQASSAISLNEVVINTSRVVGPGVSGLLLAVSSVWVCFAANACSFLPVLWVLLSDRKSSTPGPAFQAKVRGLALRGFAFAWQDRSIRVMLLLALCSSAIFNMTVALPLLAVHVFHTGGGGFGAMLAAFGVGALPGAVISATRHHLPTVRECLTLAFASGGAVLLTVAARSLDEFFVAIALVGMISIWFIARTNAFVLLNTPADLRGTVMGIWTLAMPGLYPVTGLVVGVVSTHLGPRFGYAMAGPVIWAVLLAHWVAVRRAGRRPSAATGSVGPHGLCSSTASGGST